MGAAGRPARRRTSGSARRPAGTSPPRSTSRRSPTLSSWRRAATRSATRAGASSRPPTSRSSRRTPGPSCQPTPPGTRWTPCRRPPSTTARSSARRRNRLRAKLSYTNIGFALAPETFTISQLRDTYAAALGHPVSATNLQRILTRRGVIEPTSGCLPPRVNRRPPGHGLPLRRPRAGRHQPLRRLPPPRRRLAEYATDGRHHPGGHSRPPGGPGPPGGSACQMRIRPAEPARIRDRLAKMNPKPGATR